MRCGPDLGFPYSWSKEQKTMKSCPFWHLQVGVCDSSLCFYLNFHHLAFMNGQMTLILAFNFFWRNGWIDCTSSAKPWDRFKTNLVRRELAEPSASVNPPLGIWPGNFSQPHSQCCQSAGLSSWVPPSFMTFFSASSAFFDFYHGIWQSCFSRMCYSKHKFPLKLSRK